MRLLLITNDYPPKPGGIQQYLGNLVARYQGEVLVLGPADPGAEADRRVHRSKWKFMWPTPAVRRWTIEQARSFRPDAILFGAPHPLPWLGPALRAATGAPYGVLSHGAEITIPAFFPVTRQLLAGPLKQADFLLANGEFTRSRVARLTGREVDVIGIGVDLDAFSPPAGQPTRNEPRNEPTRNEPTRNEPTRNETVIGSVSRFVPRKRQGAVIAAAAGLYEAGHAVRVKIVGRGRLEGKLRAQAGRLPVPVDFHVDVPWSELPDLYRQMDVFAVPTRSRWFGLEAEGLGIVYLEAAASGLPVIAGTSGGSPETVRPGLTGYVVHDDDSLLEALRLLVTDAGKRAGMGEAGRRFMEESFTWEAVMERLNTSLERAVNPAS